MAIGPGADDGPTEGGAGSVPRPGEGAEGGSVAKRLVGDLPCYRCGYNLRGLSVRSVCPECGTPVRAAIVAAVDPYAEVLRPIRAPRLVAAALVAWSGGAFLAAILIWVVRLSDLWTSAPGSRTSAHWAALPSVVAVAVSGAGALALVAPHAELPRRKIAAAALAVAGYVPLVWYQWWIHCVLDPQVGPAFSGPEVMVAERSAARLVWAALAAAILLGLRPNARALAARSLLLRSGRVDRQTMLAMTAALALGAVGDGVHLLGHWRLGSFASAAWLAGTCLIGVASMLLTVGLSSAVVDCVRIAGVLLEPHPAMRRVLGETGGRGGAEEDAL